MFLWKRSQTKFMKQFLILKNWITFCCFSVDFSWAVRQILDSLVISALTAPPTPCQTKLDAPFICMLKWWNSYCNESKCFSSLWYGCHSPKESSVFQDQFLSTPKSSYVVLYPQAKLDWGFRLYWLLPCSYSWLYPIVRWGALESTDARVSTRVIWS